MRLNSYTLSSSTISSNIKLRVLDATSDVSPSSLKVLTPDDIFRIFSVHQKGKLALDFQYSVRRRQRRRIRRQWEELIPCTPLECLVCLRKRMWNILEVIRQSPKQVKNLPLLSFLFLLLFLLLSVNNFFQIYFF